MLGQKIWAPLKQYCQSTEIDLLDLLREQDDYKITRVGNTYYAYLDRGSNVLAVAHMDVTHYVRGFQGKYQMGYNLVTSPALDDRLGVFIITKLLPLYGIFPDILLTTDEEIGLSTAELFHPDKKYNWTFSFDRSGGDVVLYEYETKKLCNRLAESGFTVGNGSFSDICYLTHLKCAGFNFGTGYYHEHTKRCYADLSITRMMIGLFARFYKMYKDTRFSHTPVPYTYHSYGTYDYRKYADFGKGYGKYTSYNKKTGTWEAPGNGACETDELSSWDARDALKEEEAKHTYYTRLSDSLAEYSRYSDSYGAIAFQYLHEQAGHELDHFIINKREATMVCYTCDKEIIYKDM